MCCGWSDFCTTHELGNGYKLILSCERRWIFNIIICDENDVELRYDWSGGVSPYWQELHAAKGKTHTKIMSYSF